MSYEHCEKHDRDATNGCPICDREESLPEGWFWVPKNSGGFYAEHANGATADVRVGKVFVSRRGVPIAVVQAVIDHHGDVE